MTPIALLHSVKHFHVLHERNVILGVETLQVPRVDAADRATITALGGNFYRIVLRYGFMQQPDIPDALVHCSAGGEGFDLMQTSFFESSAAVVRAPSRGPRLNVVFCRLFAWMQRNETAATEFFNIPRNRIVQLGAQIEL